MTSPVKLVQEYRPGGAFEPAQVVSKLSKVLPAGIAGSFDGLDLPLFGGGLIVERRAFPKELRDKVRRLEGYAVLFGVDARIGGGKAETIAPGAFGASLWSGEDILGLVDHHPSRVLGRTRSGTLRLTEDAQGLAFDLDVPDTQAGREVLALAELGDLGGMSFGFVATGEARDGDRLELRAVDLIEISVVAAWPAYDGTVVNARSRQMTFPRRAAAERVLGLHEALS